MLHCQNLILAYTLKFINSNAENDLRLYYVWPRTDASLCSLSDCHHIDERHRHRLESLTSWADLHWGLRWWIQMDCSRLNRVPDLDLIIFSFPRLRVPFCIYISHLKRTSFCSWPWLLPSRHVSIPPYPLLFLDVGSVICSAGMWTFFKKSRLAFALLHTVSVSYYWSGQLLGLSWRVQRPSAHMPTTTSFNWLVVVASCFDRPHLPHQKLHRKHGDLLVVSRKGSTWRYHEIL